MSAPGWPDIRGWATIAMFAMVFYILHLLATHPELASNELFKTVVTLLIGSGAFGLVCAFLWGGSKASVAAADTVNTMAKASAIPAQPAPGSVTVTPPATVNVETTEAKP